MGCLSCVAMKHQAYHTKSRGSPNSRKRSMQQAGHLANPTAMLALFCIQVLVTRPWSNPRTGVFLQKGFREWKLLAYLCIVNCSERTHPKQYVNINISTIYRYG